MISLQSLDRLAAPYPVGVAHDVFAPADLDAMVRAFPDESTFAPLAGSSYRKLSLSPSSNPTEYQRVTHDVPIWRAFADYMRGGFMATATAALGAWGVTVTSAHALWWEFSSLPAEGGMLLPHTDVVSKRLSLVIWMMRPGEWDPAWGGGMDVLADARTVLHTIDYEPNAAIVFAKTQDSWHGVRPIHAPAGRWRRTLTVAVNA